MRNLGLQNDFVEAAERKFEEQLDAMFEQRIDQIASEAGAPESDHEYRQRLKHSLRLFSDLVQRGLEVEPALLAPTEVRSQFPQPAKLAAALKQLAGPKKELESGNDPASA